MLVSHLHKFIYIKSFKVGGTSTELFFQPFCQPASERLSEATNGFEGKEGIVGARARFTDGRDRPRFWNHMTAADIYKAIGAGTFDAYFKFANVRNPFDLATSAAFQLAKQEGKNIKRLARIGPWLDRFLSQKNPQTTRVTQSGAVVLDDVIRFEDLDNECHRIASKLGIPSANTATFPHLKARKSPIDPEALFDLWTESRRDRLIEKEAAYFEAFGYSKSIDDAFPETPNVRSMT